MHESLRTTVHSYRWLCILHVQRFALAYSHQHCSLAAARVTYNDYFVLLVEGLLGLKDIREGIVVGAGPIA